MTTFYILKCQETLNDYTHDRTLGLFTSRTKAYVKVSELNYQICVQLFDDIFKFDPFFDTSVISKYKVEEIAELS